MNDKHTKGEWYALDFAGCIVIQDDKFYKSNNILDYAGKYNNVKNPITKEQAEANAKLMVFAPKMLEALKKVNELRLGLDVIQNVIEGNSPPYTLREVWNQISDFITMQESVIDQL